MKNVGGWQRNSPTATAERSGGKGIRKLMRTHWNFWKPAVQVSVRSGGGWTRVLSTERYSGTDADVERLDDLVIKLTAAENSTSAILLRSIGGTGACFLSLSADDVQTLAERRIDLHLSTRRPRHFRQHDTPAPEGQMSDRDLGACSFSYSVHYSDGKQRKTFHDTNITMLLPVLRPLSATDVVYSWAYVTIMGRRQWSFVLQHALFAELARLEASLEIDCSS